MEDKQVTVALPKTYRTTMLSDTHRPQSTVLIVDDEIGPREALKLLLHQNFHICVAENAATALHILETQPIDLVTLDQRLPDTSGLDLLRDIKQRYPDVEVIIITGYGCLKSAMESLHHGAAGYLLKPFNTNELTALITQTAEKKQRLDFIRSTLRSSPDLWTPNSTTRAWHIFRETYCSFLTKAQPHAVTSPEMPWPLLLSDVLEAFDRQLWNHSCRVSLYAGLMGKQLRLDPLLYEQLTVGAFLHDIGKISPACLQGVDQHVHHDCFTTVETQHPLLGAELLHALELPAEVIDIVSHHHERWDGTGCPHGQQGEAIPLGARIVSIAEAFDEWTVDTTEQESLPFEEAARRLSKASCSLFDPTLVELFVPLLVISRASLPPLATSPFTNQHALPFPTSSITR
ncbi:MAG: response regulator [Nitrospira sp.]|nr:response regulator [Nitrospira sp.]